MMPYKPTILIDFDGVLSDYKGWQGSEAEPGPPLPNARAACFSLAKNYKLVCFTTRTRLQVEPWLAKYGFSCIEAITSIKIPAYLQIDDRAIEFRGWTDQLLQRAKSFKTHWEEKEPLEGLQPTSQAEAEQKLP